jgi:hypothetical protein
MTEYRDKDEKGHGSNPRGGTSEKDIKNAVTAWATTEDKGDKFFQIQAKVEDDIRSGNAGKNAIVVGIRNEEIKGSSYRGQYVAKNDPITEWQVGQSVQVMPSSFSGKLEVANDFASGDYFENPATNLLNQSIGKDDGVDNRGYQVIMQIGGSHNGINVDKKIGDYAPGQKKEYEHICGGRYDVKSFDRNEKTRVINIKLKQTGVF